MLEHAVLAVEPDRAQDFEAAFAQARPLITASPGFEGLRLLKRLSGPGRYLLLVEWDSVESHVHGFRESARYTEWSRLLHPFYDPFPEVEYFTSA